MHGKEELCYESLARYGNASVLATHCRIPQRQSKKGLWSRSCPTDRQWGEWRHGAAVLAMKDREKKHRERERERDQIGKKRKTTEQDNHSWAPGWIVHEPSGLIFDCSIVYDPERELQQHDFPLTLFKFYLIRKVGQRAEVWVLRVHKNFVLPI